MRKLQAPDGYYYTQAATVPAEQRIFATVVYLGKFDRQENWRLADQEERAATEKEVADARKKQEERP